jgi:hypothetical protein
MIVVTIKPMPMRMATIDAFNVNELENMALTNNEKDSSAQKHK